MHGVLGALLVFCLLASCFFWFWGLHGYVPFLLSGCFPPFFFAFPWRHFRILAAASATLLPIDGLAASSRRPSRHDGTARRPDTTPFIRTGRVGQDHGDKPSVSGPAGGLDLDLVSFVFGLSSLFLISLGYSIIRCFACVVRWTRVGYPPAGQATNKAKWSSGVGLAAAVVVDVGAPPGRRTATDHLSHLFA